MANFATYGAAMLPGPGKKGILKRLDNDYKECLLGALGATSNGGWIYDERSAIHYMQNNPEFLQMMADKRMRSEWGHPVRTPGMSDEEWFVRVHTIFEPNWSSHIRRIHLTADLLKDPKGRACIGIIGEVRGCGVHGDAFERIIENPDEDLNYSVRSFARKEFSTWRKHVTKIINFDTVWTPGQPIASKFSTPSMESATPEWDVGKMLDEAEFHLDDLRSRFNRIPVSDESFESSNHMVTCIDGLLTANTKTTVSMQSVYRWGVN